MTIRHLRRGFTLTALALLAASTADVRAELGGIMAAPQTAASALPHALATSGMQMRSSVDAGGTTINEYVSNDGVVFAYAWQGPTMPDLTRLLGRYAEPYRATATSRLTASGDLHASRVEQADVIVESGGQMRSYVGRAWLPGSLPPGVSPGDLH